MDKKIECTVAYTHIYFITNKTNAAVVLLSASASFRIDVISACPAQITLGTDGQHPLCGARVLDTI